MKIQTRDFGEIEINTEEIITFCSGIYGFEDYKNFVLLYDDTVDAPFTWLQSTEEKNICFILAEAEAVGILGYHPKLTIETRSMLELGNDEPVYRLITVIPEKFEDASVNLKSPIVLNVKTKMAAQVILEDNYPIRARLMPQKEGAR